MGITLTNTDKLVFAKLTELYPTIELLQFFDKGSTARVYRVKLPIGPRLEHRVERIIKVFRHDGQVLNVTDSEQVFQNEIQHLLAISHSNVIGLYYADYLYINKKTKVPYFVTEYIPGAQDLDEWIDSHISDFNSELLIDLLMQAATGLDALHSAGVYHCDIKSGNLLVGDGAKLKLADLGFSKVIKGWGGMTGVFTTLEYYPSTYKKYIKKLDDPRRMQIEIPRSVINPQFDLHYLGKVITALLLSPQVSSRLDMLDYKSLELMAQRMDLDHKDSRLEPYKSAADVIADLRKLQRLYLSRPGLPELSSYTGTRTLRIPVTGSISFTRRLQAVVSHPLFHRLHQVTQLGLTYYVFPGATHTRFEHSLGVYSNVARYINSLLSDDYEPYFRQVIDEQKIATTLLAGLLHDVGQSSFAHSLEDMGLVRPHEEISAQFIEGRQLSQYVPEYMASKHTIAQVLADEWPEVDVKRLLWMIHPPSGSSLPTDTGWEIMRSIISGPLDADKTDYLIRDAHHAGVEYARSIDIARFMNSLTASVVREGSSMKGVLAITWKGTQAAEMITLARTQMFWVLYWHHAVRSAHAMLAHAAYYHERISDEKAKTSFRKAMFCASIDELLAILSKSPSAEAKKYASMLRLRQLYKRCLSLEYLEDEATYNTLLDRKELCEGEGDYLLNSLRRSLSHEMNRTLRNNGSNTKIAEPQIIVDIPKAGKDKLGTIYIVHRNDNEARPYNSRMITGGQEDWQNRARTVRVFLSPDVPRVDRETLFNNRLSIFRKV